MSSSQGLEGATRQPEEKRDDGRGDGGDNGDKQDSNKKPTDGDAEMDDVEEEEDILDEEVLSLSTQDLLTRKRLLENDARIMKSEFQRLSHEKATMGEKIKENQDKIANNRYPSHLTRDGTRPG